MMVLMKPEVSNMCIANSEAVLRNGGDPILAAHPHANEVAVAPSLQGPYPLYLVKVLDIIVTPFLGRELAYSVKRQKTSISS